MRPSLLCLLALAACGDPVEITSASTSYGECLGECVFDLSFSGDAVVLDIHDHDGTPYNLNAGTLTADGLDRVAVVEEGIGRVQLDESYGCPGCDDGGVRALAWLRDGVEERTAWEEGNPPSALVRAEALIDDLDDALRRCVTTPDVVIDAGCVPEGS